MRFCDEQSACYRVPLAFWACVPDQDVVSPGRMRRKIHNPRVLLLDCPLEYKKGENQTNVELSKRGGLVRAPAPCCALPWHACSSLMCQAASGIREC